MLGKRHNLGLLIIVSCPLARSFCQLELLLGLYGMREEVLLQYGSAAEPASVRLENLMKRHLATLLG